MTRNIFRRVHSYLLLTAMALLPAIPAWAAVHDVQVLNNLFSPAVLNIQPGDTVRWTNPQDMGIMHDVTADDGSFNSITASEFVYEMTFTTVGDIPYFCTVHSVAGGTSMNGTIVVMPAAATAEIGIDSVDVTNGSYQNGDTVEVKAMLTNSGDGDSGMFNVSFNATSDIGPITIGTVAVSNIAAGTSMEVMGSFALPPSLETGYWTIGAVSGFSDGNTANDAGSDATTIFVFDVFIINAGLNDAWFNIVTDGQGFFVTVFADVGRIFVAWFTYDTELPPEDAIANLGDAGHRWTTAAGDIVGNKSDMIVTIAWGGLFDTAGSVAPVSRREDGTMTIEFENCNAGTLTYDIPSIDQQGVVPISRVAGDNIKLCEAFLIEMSQSTP
jgi:plastocyanin